MSETEEKLPRATRRRAMRGIGRLLKRGRIWHIAFYHRGEEIRESSGSENESVARKLLKRRLAETQTGRFIADEEKVTFENLAEGLVTDYKLNGRRSLKTAALNNVKHLRAFFGFDRAIDISSDRLKTYQLRRRRAHRSHRSTANARHCVGCSLSPWMLASYPVGRSSTCWTVKESGKAL